MKYNKLCVIGLGYIGLPTASTFAMHGVETVGVDITPSIIETLNRGEIHIHEPGLREAFNKALESGKFKASLKPEEADAFIIAVPTPFKHDETGTYQDTTYKLADMGAVIAAAESIVPYLRKGNVVVLESTSPPRKTIVERTSLALVPFILINIVALLLITYYPPFSLWLPGVLKH